MPGWQSIETVSLIQNILSILGYISLAALLFFEVGAHIYSNRKEYLQEQLASQKDVEVTKLKVELATERNTLRSFTAVESIYFSGRWDEADLPFSNSQYMMQPTDTFFVQMVVKINDSFQAIKLYGTKMYTFSKLAPGKYVFTVDLSLKPDDPMLGVAIDSLKDRVMAGTATYLPIVFPNKLKNPNLEISSIKMDFKINNQRQISKIYDLNTKVTPTQIPDHRFVEIPLPIVGSDFQ